ncbi:MAG: LD-carboxypeptidase [bacterium]|nr:LD-carboxypeptidase [bacterium]
MKALRIHVVAPAGPVDEARLEAGLDFLRGRGIEVVEGRSLRGRWGHLAGRDGERAADLVRALLDPAADAVWAARGGFGGLRLLSHLDCPELAGARRRPPLIGYSDLTSLQNCLVGRLGWPAWHAPMVATELGAPLDPCSEASLDLMLASLRGQGAAIAARQAADGAWNLVEEEELADCPARVVLEAGGVRQVLGLHGTFVWQAGTAEGPLAGGNLSVLTSLFGGSWEPYLGETCLLLEDHGEYPFRLDRHLAQLANQGALRRARALLLGSFIDCAEPDPAKVTFTAEELLRHYAAQVSGPVLAGLPFGHRAPRLSLPMPGRCLVTAVR